MTIKIGVFGQGMPQMIRLIKERSGGRIEGVAVGDVDGAVALRDGKLDYLVGVCYSGAGSALGGVIAVLGREKTGYVSFISFPPKEEKVRRMVMEGKVAFGLAREHIEKAIPMVVKVIMEKEKLG